MVGLADGRSPIAILAMADCDCDADCDVDYYIYFNIVQNILEGDYFLIY